MIAEAGLAELYTDEALDRAADRWTRQVEVAPTDFVQPHLGTMEYEAVSFNHGEVENSKAVHVTWEGETWGLPHE